MEKKRNAPSRTSVQTEEGEAMMPSLMRIESCCAQRVARARVRRTELTTPIVVFRCSPSGVSACQSVRITFTNMRVPSLLIAVESRENLVQPRRFSVLNIR